MENKYKLRAETHVPGGYKGTIIGILLTEKGTSYYIRYKRLTGIREVWLNEKDIKLIGEDDVSQTAEDNPPGEVEAPVRKKRAKKV